DHARVEAEGARLLDGDRGDVDADVALHARLDPGAGGAAVAAADVDRAHGRADVGLDQLEHARVDAAALGIDAAAPVVVVVAALLGHRRRPQATSPTRRPAGASLRCSRPRR